MFVIFSLKNAKRGHKLELTYLYTCWITHMTHHLQIWKWNTKGGQKWRSGIQYVAMVRKLLSSYCGALLVESYCKVSNISDTNWLRYLFSSSLIKIWLSTLHHHLANLHILKTWISLEQRDIWQQQTAFFFSYRLLVCFEMASIGKMRFSS